MSYYNLSCILDKKNYKKIVFSSNQINKKETEVKVVSENNYTYISNSLSDYLSRFKEQIKLSSETWDTIKKYTNSLSQLNDILYI